MSFYREDPQWFRARASRHSENLGEIAAQALEAAYAQLDAKDALIRAGELTMDKIERLNLDLGMCYSEAIQAECDAYQALRKP